MDETAAERTGLTRNQRLVLDALSRSSGPCTAYALLDALRPEGLKAPQQIYRALARLTEAGLAHRIESMNAFIACRRPGGGPHPTSIFLICRDCDGAEEVADGTVTEALAQLAARRGFAAESRTVELGGLCARCRKG